MQCIHSRTTNLCGLTRGYYRNSTDGFPDFSSIRMPLFNCLRIWVLKNHQIPSESVHAVQPTMSGTSNICCVTPGMDRVWPSGLDSNDLECRSSQRKIKLTSKCYVDLFEALDFAHFKEHFLERTGLYQKHSSILESRYTSEKCCRRSSGEADDHTVQQEWAGLPRFSKFRSIMTSTWSYK